MPVNPQDPDRLVINTIRTLAVDAVQAAARAQVGQRPEAVPAR